jgi:glucose/arabinose dehydrogenase
MDKPLASSGSEPRPKVRRLFWVLLALVVIGAVAGAIVFRPFDSPPATVITPPKELSGIPTIDIQPVATGLDHPWSIAFLPDNTPIYTERRGTISVVRADTPREVAAISDVQAGGEGGLTGLAIDPDFSSNRFIYTCYNSTSDIRVVRWKLNDMLQGLSEKHPIITGLPANPSGRHSGCRMVFGPDGYLWIGTGDAALASTPQDPKSLGGKILRVDRSGKAASGNLGNSFDPRVYSFGHRNTQGIAFLAQPIGDIVGFSAEHGSTVDDEVNVLKKGNFGWDPGMGYVERNVPMTDKQKFPDAIAASWSSGTPTQAPSGLVQIQGEKWRDWNGRLVLAMLKAQHLKLFTVGADGVITHESKIVEDRGRLRDVGQAPDGSLYVTTDNGGNNDKILRLTPR